MFNPKHLAEGMELYKQIEELRSDNTKLASVTKLDVVFLGKRINLEQGDSDFGVVRQAIIHVNEQSIAQLIRRGNQINLALV